MIDCNYLVF